MKEHLRFRNRDCLIKAGKGIACAAFALLLGAAAGEVTTEAAGGVAMHRLFNPYTAEHFYTANKGEADHLAAIGWNYEGIGWIAPEHSNTPVYRLFNRHTTDHLYTRNAGERDYLVRCGWNYEGVGWYSDDAETVPVYRQYCPGAMTGSHNYTTKKAENDDLVSKGWNAEGIGWYGVREGYSSGAGSSTSSSGGTGNWKEDSTRLFIHLFRKPIPTGSWEDNALYSGDLKVIITGKGIDSPLVYTSTGRNEMTMADAYHDGGENSTIGSHKQGHYVLKRPAPGQKLHIRTEGAAALGLQDIDADYIVPGGQYQIKDVGSAQIFSDLNWTGDNTRCCLSIFL